MVFGDTSAFGVDPNAAAMRTIELTRMRKRNADADVPRRRRQPS